ncbi:unnamed protein product [Notodromas monacha]|uniref:DUF985 domain-containing protein n=1 Tax=Notodromas monacha TaxID=399045 RepID=A0A7R9BE32_9CRUS|nr:unnamed protein product [Notodromas monacha]CAG0913692.1 unnamed protein product [Notodromas monacha]
MADPAVPECLEEVQNLSKHLGLVRNKPGETLWQISVETEEYKVLPVTPQKTDGESKTLSALSGIYGVLVGSEFVSWFHVKESANIFIWHRGASTVLIDEEGKHSVHQLGDPLENPEAKYLIKLSGSSWHAVELKNKTGFAVYNCMTAPGFSWEKLETPTTEEMLAKFPALEDTIRAFPRKASEV